MEMKRTRVIGILLAAVSGFVIIPASGALADAGPHASCMGHEASGVSPAGTADEIPGGMHQFTQLIREEFPGVPPGAIYSTIAKLHAGSHEACDAALE
jgi:hypothetical protein